MAKLRIIAEYLQFLKENKKWWLFPIVIAILVLARSSSLLKAAPSRLSFTPCSDSDGAEEDHF